MSTISRTFLDHSAYLLEDEYLTKIRTCLSRLTDEDVWRRSNEASNSIGNLMLHLCGNVTQWIIGGVGQRPAERHRAEEFAARAQVRPDDLLAHLSDVVREASAIIRGLDADALLEPRHIQGYDVTVFRAVYHVVEHFSMHTGQIILLTKICTAADLSLWQPPDG